ncbi:hypothetical protein AAG570_011594 [Ranatra chinensis]|uniref:protein-serine/threonine phosphatase n=1 Tax=Ranatra chinensis TaxID=642074 RepID=A0ABD0Z9F6_9HEMI
MGSFLDKPKTEKYNDEGTAIDLRYAVTSMQGWRIEMEDSHSVITGLKGGRPVLATKDHKPSLGTERNRIERAGGTVTIQRVNGLLAVSRALGDFEYKNSPGMKQCEQPVSPEPDVYVQERCPEDEFLVLACDGVWDVMSSADVCSYLANRLVDTCLYKGSKDNMSVVLISLPGSPEPCPEAMRVDREVDEAIRSATMDFVQNLEDIDLEQLLIMLQEENIPNLPSGGGLMAKRALIESLYKELCPRRGDPSHTFLFNSPQSSTLRFGAKDESDRKISPLETAQDASPQHSEELCE